MRLAAALLGFWLAALPAAGEPPLRVHAAASLGAALQAFDPEARLVLGASGALARQLLLGAPSDLYISANPRWMDALLEAGLAEAPLPVARNRLVLIAPREGGAASAPLRELLPAGLATRGRLAMADPAYAPLGAYSRQALAAAGLWPALRERITASPDATATLLLVARGQTPLGIVYASALALGADIRPVADLPERWHDPIAYPAAPLLEGRRALALAWLERLRAPEGQAVLVAHGFLPWRD